MKGSRLVYAALATAYAAILLWQGVEHARVRRAERAALINHAKDVSTTLGVVMRSQRRFGIISKERFESALNSLIKPGELDAIALLNLAGEVVVSAGNPIDFGLQGLIPSGEHWSRESVTLVNLVDLGTNVTADVEGKQPTLVLPRPDRFNPGSTNRPPPPPPDQREGKDRDDPQNAGMRPGPGSFPEAGTNSPLRQREWNRGRADERRPPFGRPPWMSEAEYRAAVQKQGAHSFVVVLSTHPLRAAAGRDLWLRCVIATLAAVSVTALGLAYRNVVKSSELEVRLVRAAELTARLKEMNLAAAGLAHETKNPLNIIRGLAQMISRRDDAPEEVRTKTREILDMSDRVTAQLNEFINYSRPREVRRTTVALDAIVGEVVRTLAFDVEDKRIQLHAAPGLPVIEADEQLLRQALFNLLLNAIQAVEAGGRIEVSASRTPEGHAVLEIKDNGPGVPAEHRADIFKPYYTTHQKGTGLGLAVVQQIVTAHGWEIECLANEPRGAWFRVSHLRLAAHS